MSHSRRGGQLEQGHDAFLDIVANLVGILIILVVVLGTQSQQVIEQIKREESDDGVATLEQLDSLADHAARAAAAQADSDRLESRIVTLGRQSRPANRSEG